MERSITVVVVNLTSDKLKRTSYELRGGSWETIPPGNISPSSQVRWQSKSSFTGTDGSANYESTHGLVVFYWSNPFVGKNLYKVVCPKEYKCTWSGDNANNAKVTFIIEKI